MTSRKSNPVANYILFLLLFFLLTITHAFPQKDYTLKPENGDCSHAIQLFDTIFGPTTPPKGYGNKQEIYGGDRSPYSFENEHNSTWYTFTIPYSGFLTFDIIPNNPNDDYDFILYRAVVDNVCELVSSDQIRPVRTNMARRKNTDEGNTGIKFGVSGELINSESSESYGKELIVKKDEIFYLVVDNYSFGDGHTLHLHFTWTDTTGEHKNNKEPEKITEPETQDVMLNINIMDKTTKSPVNSTLEIFETKVKAPPVKIFSQEKISNLIKAKDIKKFKNYLVKINATGYMPYSKEIEVKETNLAVNAELDKIETGKSFSFENIYFHPNNSRFLGESYPALRELKEFLLKNETVKIRVNGHVNWPAKRTTDKEAEFNEKLSSERAKAVYDYLIKEGIKPDRLSYKGFSNTKMLYPNPTNELQSLKNRRVEIEIMGN